MSDEGVITMYFMPCILAVLNALLHDFSRLI